MSSSSLEKYQANYTDVQRLLEIHETITQGVQGRHYKLEALNKSIVILLCASWEAYVEDVTREGFNFLLRAVTDPSQLPEGIRAQVAASVREGKPDAIWRLAGRGWKTVARELIAQKCDGLAGGLNTPKSKNVSQLLRTAFGFNVTQSWTWTRMTQERTREKLDQLVDARGMYAHGQQPLEAITKQRCSQFQAHVQNLVSRTDVAINAYLIKTYDRGMF